MQDTEIQVPADLEVTGSSAPASEPLAQPDQNAPSTGTEQEPASKQDPAASEPTQKEPTGDGEAEAAKPEKEKRTPWWVHRIEKHRGEAQELRQQKQALEDQLKALQTGQPADPNQPQLNQQQLMQLADQIAEQKAQVKAFNDACNRVARDGEKEFQDFREATGVLNMMGALRPEVLNPLFETCEDIEVSPHKLLYELGKSPEDAAQILGLPPHRMGAALVRFAEKATTKPTPPVTKAPAPVRPVGGATKVDPTDAHLSDEDWFNRYPEGKGVKPKKG